MKGTFEIAGDMEISVRHVESLLKVTKELWNPSGQPHTHYIFRMRLSSGVLVYSKVFYTEEEAVDNRNQLLLLIEEIK